MAMTSTRLQPIRRYADAREEEAMRRLAQRQSALDAQQARLTELRRYLSEYLNERAPAGCAAAMLGNRHAFVTRLREAENYQQRVVEQARNDCDRERVQWLCEHREAGVINLLAQSCRHREQRQQERRNERQMDELAALRHGRDALEVF